SNRVSANYGSSADNWGWLIETHQQESDGFKDIDNSSKDSGFDIEDYVIKARINTDSDAAIYQQLDFKYQYSEEVSDETYVGLTDADFNADENRRYALTELDEMKTRHSGANLRYMVNFSETFSLTTTAYYNRFKRDWFKVDKVNGGSFDSLIGAANGGDLSAQAILDGQVDTSVDIKHNNREYLSKGLQLVADWQFASHQLEAGVRYHEDDVDRFQPTEVFNQTNGKLVFSSISNPSSSNNRVESAEAVALHLMDVWTVTEALELTLGVRNENIETQQKRYSDLQRSASSITAKNDVEETLWSFGATYDLNDQWQVLAGVHSGFAPASADANENVDPEKSTNYEAGVRFQGDKLSASAIAFFSDYESTVLNCTAAFPCGAQTSGSQSLGKSEIKGLELILNATLYTNNRFIVPLMVSYTYTDAEITDADDNGSLQDGDVLRYVPENVLNAQLGLEFHSGWSTYLNASYIDEMCHNNSCDRAGVDDSLLKTDDLLVFDLVTQYPLNSKTNIYLKVDNLLDDQDIVARSPGGARPNKPRTAILGVKFSF
ncbi:MAG: TonB-dependent receptor, partial [Pseudomonadales bacterium]|nr:TonB-dependent receptor [Pseudomonadales bacterium]